MCWWQWGASDSAHTVVCVHGLTRQGRDFDRLAQALVQRSGGNIRVICPDIVGRGKSDWLKVPSGYQLPTYVADMVALLNHLAAQSSMTTLDWVGTSMGGLIGMALAGHPGLGVALPVRRLVLNDVGPQISWAAIQRIGSYLGKSMHFASEPQAAGALAIISSGFGPHTPEQWMALTQPMLKPVVTGGFALHYDPAIALAFASVTEDAARQGEAALWALYDQIKADTLLLRGALSDLLKPEIAQAMTQRGPKARLVELSGIGHAPTLVAQDQIDLVAQFLLCETSA